LPVDRRAPVPDHVVAGNRSSGATSSGTRS
jgi:hypothetical protein